MISVVVPALNEEDLIDNCLESLKRQKYQDYEVLVVDGGSTDNTYQIAQDHEGVKAYQISDANRAKQRNFGIEKSQGKTLAFLDSDMEISNNWLNEIERNIDDNTILGFPIETRVGDRKIWSFYPEDRHFPVERFMNIDGFVLTGCMAINRSLVDRYGGFPEVKFSEDRLFCQKMTANGVGLKLCEGAKAIHPVRENFSELTARWFNEGIGYREMGGLSMPSEKPRDMQNWQHYGTARKVFLLMLFSVHCGSRTFGYLYEVLSEDVSVFDI